LVLLIGKSASEIGSLANSVSLVVFLGFILRYYNSLVV
jgi:hypothetical protein